MISKILTCHDCQYGQANHGVLFTGTKYVEHLYTLLPIKKGDKPVTFNTIGHIPFSSCWQQAIEHFYNSFYDYLNMGHSF